MAWLYTRGAESVRILRLANNHGQTRLVVEGPGPLEASYDFRDTIVCLAYQSEVERQYMGAGFRLYDLTSDRRSGIDRRRNARGSDRRRAAVAA
jgi:hypothetical protein